MAAFIGALSGLLIGPTTTVFYDSGFLIGLKGFVAAIFAGLSSYPLALVGALGVGLLESFGSFWASAFKEVIVFRLDPAGAAVALAARPARRGRLRCSHLRRCALPRLRRCSCSRCRCCRCPTSGSRRATTSACTRWSSLGLVLLTGVAGLTSFGQAAFVGIGAYTAAYLAAKLGVSPWLTLLVGLALAVAGGAGAGRDHAAHVGPLPAAGDHRLGPGAVLPASATSTALGKYDGLLGIPALHALRLRPGHRARLPRPDLDDRAARGARRDAPARFAPRPRDPRAQERLDDGRGDGHLDLPLQGHRVRARGGAGRASRAGCSRTSSAP